MENLKTLAKKYLGNSMICGNCREEVPASNKCRNCGTEILTGIKCSHCCNFFTSVESNDAHMLGKCDWCLLDLREGGIK